MCVYTCVCVLRVTFFIIFVFKICINVEGANLYVVRNRATEKLRNRVEHLGILPIGLQVTDLIKSFVYPRLYLKLRIRIEHGQQNYITFPPSRFPSPQSKDLQFFNSWHQKFISNGAVHWTGLNADSRIRRYKYKRLVGLLTLCLSFLQFSFIVKVSTLLHSVRAVNSLTRSSVSLLELVMADYMTFQAFTWGGFTSLFSRISHFWFGTWLPTLPIVLHLYAEDGGSMSSGAPVTALSFAARVSLYFGRPRPQNQDD
jgi:hypothetical protein